MSPLLLIIHTPQQEWFITHRHLRNWLHVKMAMASPHYLFSKYQNVETHSFVKKKISVKSKKSYVYFWYSNSLSGTNGTIGRGSKERRFIKNDHGGSSTIQRKILDGRDKDLYDPTRKYSPTANLQQFRANKDSDNMTDEGYNTINTTIR